MFSLALLYEIHHRIHKKVLIQFRKVQSLHLFIEGKIDSFMEILPNLGNEMSIHFRNKKSV